MTGNENRRRGSGSARPFFESNGMFRETLRRIPRNRFAGTVVTDSNANPRVPSPSLESTERRGRAFINSKHQPNKLIRKIIKQSTLIIRASPFPSLSHTHSYFAFVSPLPGRCVRTTYPTATQLIKTVEVHADPTVTRPTRADVRIRRF